LYIKSISITYEEADASKVATPTISGTTSFLTSTEVSISCSTDDATIQYSTDDGETWNEYSTALTFTETTTVKAKATKDGLTDSDVASQTFTKVTPMTVAEALEAISALANNGTISNSYVSGIVCTTGSLNNDNTITYYISADGTATNRLQVYKGKGLNNTNFSSADDIQEGDNVTIFGELKKYVSGSNTTPEFNSGNYLVSLTRKSAPGLAWSAATFEARNGQANVYPTLTNTNGVSVTYSSSEEEVATIAADGTITLVANGETAITASFAGNDDYLAQEVSYTLTVKGFSKDAAGISFAESEINLTYGDDFDGQELTNPNSLTVTWSSSDEDVALVEDGVVVIGQAGTAVITAEFAGNEDYNEATVSYTINIAKAEAGLSFDGTAFTVAPGADFTVPTFNNPNNLTVTWSSTDEDIAIADATSAVIGTKEGTATITASFAGNDCYNAGSASYTITVSNNLEYTFDLSTDQTTTATTSEMSWTGTNVTMRVDKDGASTSTNNYYPGANNRTSTRFYTGSKLTITPASGYMITSVEFTATTTGYANALNSSTWTNATANVSDMKVTVTPTDWSEAISAAIGATCGFTAVKVTYKALPESVPATIAASGYTSLASGLALDFANATDGESNKTLKAYVISAITKTAVTLTTVESAPAGTGLILKGTANAEYTIPVTDSPAEVTTNELSAAVNTTTVEAESVYVVSGGELKLYTGTSVPAGKAYLLKSKVDAVTTDARNLSFVFNDGETTGISNVEDAQRQLLSGDFYNLNGQRVAAPAKGLYIVNGRKVVVK